MPEPSASARAEQAAQNAIDRIDARSRAALTNQQKRAKELEQYRKDLEAIREVNPNDDRLQQATIDREIANINVKYKDQKGSAGSVDLRAVNAAKNSLARSPRPTVARKKNWRHPTTRRRDQRGKLRAAAHLDHPAGAG